MSEKDKKTIIIAAIALLIFGIIMLGIKPGIANLKEAKAQNAELSAQKQEMQTQIEALPTLKTQLEAAKADYAATAARVYGDLTNDKIHDAVVEFVSSCGLQTTSFAVNGINTASVTPYAINEGVGAGGEGEGTVKLAYVTISVYGTKDQIIALIDKINTTEGTFLQQTSFTDSGEATSVQVTYDMVLADSFD